MTNLRFLSITPRYTKIGEAGGYLPNSLRCLNWSYYRFRYLPKIFQADNLVRLCMKGSYICRLWEGGEKKVLPKLKFLDLSRSKLETFDLEMTPNLEELVLTECDRLIRLNMSIKCLNLKKLDLYLCCNFIALQMPVQCPKLESLNCCYTKLTNLNLGLTPNLKCLRLDCCSLLVELHVAVECPKLITLELGGFKVSDFKPDLAPFLEKLESLESLSLSSLDIECLPYSICMLKHLIHLKIKFCSHLKELPEDLGRLGCLEKLDLQGCKSLQHIPNSICKLERLESLELYGCKKLKNLPDDLYSMKSLKTVGVRGSGICSR